MNADEIHDQVLALSASQLSRIVRKVLSDESAFVLPDIKVRHVTAPSRRGDTVGLLRVEGQAKRQQQHVDWSVILKVVRSPGILSKAERNSGEREVVAYEYGFLDREFVGVRPATLFHTIHQDGLTWMWIEDLQWMNDPP